MTLRVAGLSVAGILVGVLSFPISRGVVASQVPLTPGSVALIANNVDEKAIETLRRAITSDDPMIRAVGARLAGANAAAPLADAIVGAWDREQDPTVAAEQVRALLFIRGALASDLIEARLNTSSHVALVYAEWLARVQPEKLANRLPTLSARLSDDRTELNPIVHTALNRRPATGEQLLRAWLATSTPVAWRGFLTPSFPDSSRPGQDAVLVEALAFQDSGIREATVWSVVGWLATGRSVPREVLDAALPHAGQDLVTLDRMSLTWEQFGREVIARLHTGKETPDRSAFVTGEASKHFADARMLAAIGQLTQLERRALRAALGDAFPKQPTDLRAMAALERSGRAMRTMPTLWPGFLKQLLDGAGCKAGDPPISGIVRVDYGPDGRIGRVSVNPTALSASCEHAVAALARLTTAEPLYSPVDGEPEWLILPLDKNYIECAGAPESAGTERPVRLGQERPFAPPRKLRDVQPVYPTHLQQSGATGTVVLEAVISKNGCVPTVRVLRGADPTFDFAALHAVSGWRFAATRVGDREVPVMMTVTINFKLR